MSAENLFVVFIILAAIFVFALIGYSIYLECRNPPNAEQARKLCQAGIDHIFRDSYESLQVFPPNNYISPEDWLAMGKPIEKHMTIAEFTARPRKFKGDGQ